MFSLARSSEPYCACAYPCAMILSPPFPAPIPPIRNALLFDDEYPFPKAESNLSLPYVNSCSLASENEREGWREGRSASLSCSFGVNSGKQWLRH